MTKPKTPQEAIEQARKAVSEGRITYAPSEEAVTLAEYVDIVVIAIVGKPPIFISDKSTISDFGQFASEENLAKASKELGIVVSRHDRVVDAARRLMQYKTKRFVKGN